MKDADSIARFNGEDTVTISMTKNQSASTIGMVNDVKKVMKNISEQNENAVIEASYDASEMIFESLSSVGSTLALGVILSMIVLFIFFGDWKASIIVGCSMPISLLMTVIVMALMGFSLNIMTLGGLVIAIGMMVDSSSVVIESCFRARYHRSDFLYCGIHHHNGCCISAVVLLRWNDRTDLYAAGSYDCILPGGIPDLCDHSGTAVL